MHSNCRCKGFVQVSSYFSRVSKQNSGRHPTSSLVIHQVNHSERAHFASPIPARSSKYGVIHKTGSRPTIRIATPLEEDRATTTGNTATKIDEVGF